MRNLIFVTWLISIPFICFSQDKVNDAIVIKDKNGIIKSVEFPDSSNILKIPSSSDVFFKNLLLISVNDEFKEVPQKSKNKEFKHEHFDQYYK